MNIQQFQLHRTPTFNGVPVDYTLILSPATRKGSLNLPALLGSLKRDLRRGSDDGLRILGLSATPGLRHWHLLGTGERINRKYLSGKYDIKEFQAETGLENLDDAGRFRRAATALHSSGILSHSSAIRQFLYIVYILPYLSEEDALSNYKQGYIGPRDDSLRGTSSTFLRLALALGQANDPYCKKGPDLLSTPDRRGNPAAFFDFSKLRVFLEDQIYNLLIEEAEGLDAESFYNYYCVLKTPKPHVHKVLQADPQLPDFREKMVAFKEAVVSTMRIYAETIYAHHGRKL